MLDCLDFHLFVTKRKLLRSFQWIEPSSVDKHKWLMVCRSLGDALAAASVNSKAGDKDEENEQREESGLTLDYRLPQFKPAGLSDADMTAIVKGLERSGIVRRTRNGLIQFASPLYSAVWSEVKTEKYMQPSE